MRKKLIWIIAIIVGALAFAITLTYGFDSGNLLPGVENSSAFIERFNAGNPPDGIELDSMVSEDSIYHEGGYICQVVRVVGNENLRFLIYSRRLNGEVYAIRIDEIIDVYSSPTKLAEINDYLYTEFFTNASDREIINSHDEFAFLTETEKPFSSYLLDSEYFKCIFFDKSPDQSDHYMRTTIYSSLPSGFARALPYPFGG